MASPGSAVRLEQLGDAEVEQLDPTVRGDQHVGRFEIPVHDEVRVRVRDRRQDVQKQADTRGDAELSAVAVAVDLLAVDVLQHQKGLADRREAGVDEMRDVRVRQPREDVALSRETLFAGVADQRGVQQLHGDPALESAVAAFGQPHASHASLADRLDEAVRADLHAGERGPRGEDIGNVFQKAHRAHRVEFGEPGRNPLGDGRMLSAERRQPDHALVARELQRSVEVRAHGSPAFVLAFQHVSQPESITRAEWRRAPRGGDRGAPSASFAARSVPTLLSSPRSPRRRSRKRI